MKNTFLVLFLLCFLTGCNDRKLTHQETVSKYYSAFDSSHYHEISALIHDTIILTSGDYVTPYTHKSFYEFFKWDSIFQTSYKIVQLKAENDQIIAAVASNSVRFKFLKNDPLTCNYKISFTSGKISKIESLDCPGTDWDVWQKERDSLVYWIKNNHPHLDGFINDLTMDGALNYLKAIELYETDNNTL